MIARPVVTNQVNGTVDRSVRRGFTLIEILIVVVILGILSSIVIPQFSDATTEAQETAAHSQLKVLRGQVIRYYAKNGTVDPLGVDVDELVGTLSAEQLLTSVPVDIDTDAPGFQVARGYTLTWTQGPRWSLEVLGPDGASTGW